MRHQLIVLGAGLLLLLSVIGCEKSSDMATQPGMGVQVTSQDQSAMGSLIARDPIFTTDAAALSDAVPSLSKIGTAIVPHGWGRKIQNVSRTVTYDHVDDSTVIATVTNTLTGQVWIHVKQSPNDTIIYKPLEETTIRKVEFRQVSIAGFDSLRNWRMAAVSGVQGGTVNNGLIIQNITFFIDDDTVSVNNPLDSLFQFVRGYKHWGVRELRPNHAAQFKLHVTVKSTDPDSDIVVAHRPVWFSHGLAYGRASMKLLSSTSNGDGTFTRVYENDWKWQSAFVGRYSVYTSAITRQSIYDDQTPFSSNVWALPYVVE